MRRGLVSYGLLLVLGCSSSMRALQARADRSDAPAVSSPQDEGQTERQQLLVQSEASPKDPLPLARLGLLEARRGKYGQAIAFYRRALALNPQLPGLRLNLGLALFKDGQYPAAIDIFTRLLRQPQSQPESDRLTFLLGMSHYGLAEYGAAVPFLQQAADRDPQNLPLLLTLAHSCLLSKQYPCVVDSYHRMIAQSAESAEADMLVGEALDEMKDTGGAIQEFRAAVRANPREPNAHFGLGYLLWTQEQYEEASEQFRAELASTPEHLQAMLYLADASLRLNKVDEAGTLLETVCQRNPSSSLAHLDLGIVEEDRGRNEEAVREYKKAIALAPSEVNGHMRLGRLDRSMGNATEAREEFLKAKALSEASHAGVMNVMPAAKSTAPQAEPQTLKP